MSDVSQKKNYYLYDFITMCDLIVCAAMPRNEKETEKLGITLNSIQEIKFNTKYILFDGAPERATETQINNYSSLKQVFVKNSEFKVVEFKTNLYYKSMLEKFMRCCDIFNELSDNLFIIQDDVQLDKIDLVRVLKDKEDKEDCKILYFGENRPKAPHWFEVISDDELFVQTHGWSERVWIIKKKDLIGIFNYLSTLIRGGCNGKFIEYYYQNKKKRKYWQYLPEFKKLDYWSIWGCYEYKNVFHKHLVMKR